MHDRVATFCFMTDAYFAVRSETANGGTYSATEHTAGPWAARLQHGGPPNALAVRAAERAIAAESGRSDLVALRLAADFVGPVPVAELTAMTRVIRAARSAALVEVRLSADGRDCLLARVWFVRAADTSAIAHRGVPPVAVPDESSRLDYEFGYGSSLDWRFVSGRMGAPGPAQAWVRPTVPLLDGYEFSSLARAVLIADSGSGISAELDWNTWSFLNVDLDVHLARPVVGDALLMQAQTHLGPDGSALARSTLSDATGVVGAGLQTLVLAPSLPRS